MTETEWKWAERVREWRASGQSAADYAEGRGFKASTLRFWASRLGGAVGSDTQARWPSPVRMARVVAPAKPTALTVRVGGARVEVHRGFDRALLRELIEALGGAS